MQDITGVPAGWLAAAGLALALALPAQAQTYRCTAPGGRTTFQQTPCAGQAPAASAARPAAQTAAPPAPSNPACAETSAAILERQAEVRKLEDEGESRAVAQDKFLRPGDQLVGTWPVIRQEYAKRIATTQDEIQALRQAARKLGCPTH